MLRCFTDAALASSYTLGSTSDRLKTPSGGLISDSDMLRFLSGVPGSGPGALMAGSAILGFLSVTLRCFTDEALAGLYRLGSASDAPGLSSDTLGSGSDMLSVSLDMLKFASDTNAAHERRTFFKKMRQKGHKRFKILRL